MKIIISIASYPERYQTLHKCLESVFAQTYPVDKIILNIAHCLDVIPANVKKFCEMGLEIQYVNNDLKCHNKYYYTIKKYPNDIIITLDDDVIYPNDLVDKLIKSYSKFPHAVSCGRAHQIIFDSLGRVLPYSNWKNECQIYNTPSMQLFATGVGGILYPPKCMNEELFNKSIINKYCLYADDIWLKFMQLKNKTPVTLITQEHQHPKGIPKVFDNGLFINNKFNGKNDECIKQLNRYYKNILHKENL